MNPLALFISVLIGLSGFAQGAPAFEEDIEEIPHLYQGDILLRDDDSRIRNGLINDTYKWPNGNVVIELDSNFTVQELALIFAGFAEIANTTCITFTLRTPGLQPDYVFVQKGAEGSGCYSEVGRVGGRQVLNLEPRCVDRHGTIIHEMLHALGFYHEQSRPDRDDYITVVWDKIRPGLEYNFERQNETEVTTFGAPYDYGSVLHYGAFGFSIDGNRTLIPRIPGVEIGQRLQISQLDAGKVRLMYNCSNNDVW